MADQLAVDMIVRAISEGFDKISKDIAGVGSSFDKSSKQITDANKKVEQSSQSATSAVVQGAKQQEQAYASMSNKMAFQAQMMAQKHQEQIRNLEALSSQSLKLAAGYGAVAVAGGALLGSSIKLAARVETLGVVTAQLGKNVGMTEEEMRALEQSVMDQGITMQQARVSIARMVQGQIDLAHATDLARLAQDAAVIAGINSSDAFEQLTTAISTGQVRMLRTLGIMGTFEQAYKDMAEATGKTTDELTELEKVQARTNMVLEQGANITGAYESAMTTAGKKVLSLDRHIEESKRMLGEVWLPVYADVIDMVTASLKTWEELDQAQQQTVSSMLAVVTVSSAVMTGLLGVVSVGAKVVKTMQDINRQATLMGVGLGSVAGAATVVVTAITAMAAAAYLGHQRGQQLKDTLRDLEKQARDTADSQEEYKDALNEIASEYGLVINAEGDLVRRQHARQTAIETVVIANYQLTESEQQANAAREKAIEMAGKSEETERKAAQAIELSEEALAKYQTSSERHLAHLQRLRVQRDIQLQQEAQLAASASALAIIEAGLAAGLRGALQDAMERNSETMQRLTEEHDELIEKKQDLLKRGYDEEGKKIKEVNDALDENAQKQQEASEAIREATAEMIYQQAAAGLDAQAALDLARSMGILSESDYALSTAIQMLREHYGELNEAGEFVIKNTEAYNAEVLAATIASQALAEAGVDVTLYDIAKGMEAAGVSGSVLTAILPGIGNEFDNLGGAAEEGVGRVDTAIGNAQEKMDEFSTQNFKAQLEEVEIPEDTGIGGVESDVDDAQGAVDSFSTDNVDTELEGVPTGGDSPLTQMGQDAETAASKIDSNLPPALRGVGAAGTEQIAPLNSVWSSIRSGATSSKGTVDALRGSINALPSSKIITIRINVIGDKIPKLQHGGKMEAGMVGLVGEAGPELFVAPVSGEIVPHTSTTTLFAGMGTRAGMTMQSTVTSSSDTYQDIYMEGDSYYATNAVLSTVRGIAQANKMSRMNTFMRG